MKHWRVACILWLVIIVAVFIAMVVFPSPKAKAVEINKLDHIQSVTAISMEHLSYDTLMKKIQNEDLALAEIEPKSQPVYPLTDYERWLVESIVTGESGNQPYDGKVAVASCILNACIKDNLRPAEVQAAYGYAGWYDINSYANANPTMAQEVKQAVSQVFDDGQVLSGEILWFYNPDYGYSSFHESQSFVIKIGGHKFFKPIG